MTKEDKSRLYYRIFIGMLCILIGFAFYLIPALAKTVDGSIVDGKIEGIKFSLTTPLFFIFLGLGILTGLFDFMLAYALGLKKALKKVNK